MRTWLLAVAALGACTSDPTLQVVVVHDPAYAMLVTKTVVSVYELAALTCDQVAFGDVADDVLRGAQVAEADGGGSLSNLSRTDPKIVVARGYGADGSLVTAGCTEKDLVAGNDSVTVNTVATATVTFSSNIDTNHGLLITATDNRNESIDGRMVYWKLYGAAGTSADAASYINDSDGVWEPKHPTCTVDGDATIHPMLPKLPGGYGLRLRVQWATQRPPLITAFTPFDPTSIVVAPGGATGSPVISPCAVDKHGGQLAIVCLPDAATARTYTYAIGAPGTLTPSAPISLPVQPPDDPWVGVVAIDAATPGDRDVYAISTKGTWHGLDGASGEIPGTWCVGATGPLRCSAGFSVSQLKVVPSCNGKLGYLLAHVVENGGGGGVAKLRISPLRGGAGQEFAIRDATEIGGAGCVAELQADKSTVVRQVVVLDGVTIGMTGTQVNAAVFDCAATRSPCTVQLPTVSADLGFYPGSEPHLIGTSFDATGATLDQWVFIAAGARDRLVVRSRQSAAAPPRQLVLGNFDSDNQVDLLWTFSTRTDTEIQIAYARQAEGVPLSAVTVISLLAQPIQMFTADFDNDGYDEVVLVVQTVVGATALVVIPTGIPYSMTQPTTTDAGCP